MATIIVMIVLTSSRRCAVDSCSPLFGKRLAIVFALLIVWVGITLNLPGYLIERTNIVHRLGVPILLIVGLIGSARYLTVLRAAGWVAIIWFMPAIMYSTPDLEHAAPKLRGFPTLWRFTLTVVLFLALVAVYWMLRVKGNKMDNNKIS